MRGSMRSPPGVIRFPPPKKQLDRAFARRLPVSEAPDASPTRSAGRIVVARNSTFVVPPTAMEENHESFGTKDHAMFVV